MSEHREVWVAGVHAYPRPLFEGTRDAATKYVRADIAAEMLETLLMIRDAAGVPIPDDTLALASSDEARDMMHIGFGVAFMSIQKSLLAVIAKAQGKDDAR